MNTQSLLNTSVLIFTNFILKSELTDKIPYTIISTAPASAAKPPLDLVHKSIKTFKRNNPKYKNLKLFFSFKKMDNDKMLIGPRYSANELALLYTPDTLPCSNSCGANTKRPLNF